METRMMGGSAKGVVGGFLCLLCLLLLPVSVLAGMGEETRCGVRVEKEEEGSLKQVCLSASDGRNVEVTVTGKLPADASLQVRELEGAEFEAYSRVMEEQMGDAAISGRKLFDISIMKDGKEMEPEEEVEVSLRLLDKKTSTYEEGILYHFPTDIAVEGEEQGIEEQGLEEQVGESPSQDLVEILGGSIIEDEEGTLVQFSSDRFSVYGMLFFLEKEYISACGETYAITVAFDEEAGIPEDAFLEVEELLEGEEEYLEYMSRTAEALGKDHEELTHLRMFDIHILSGEGERIEPLSPVQVTVDYDTPALIDQAQSIQVVHFGSEGTEVLESETNRGDDSLVDEFTFETESFSIYSITSSGNTENLNGKTFALIDTYTNNALQAEDHPTLENRLKALSVTIHDGHVFTEAGENVSFWTFESVGQGKYKIHSENGYLRIDGTTVSVSQVSHEEAQALNVTVGIDNGTVNREGKIRITNDESMALNNYYGTTDGGFAGYWIDGSDNEWFTLFSLGQVELYPGYTGRKISVGELKDGKEVLIYRPFYNEAKGIYEDYCLVGNGELVKAYDKSDRIMVRSEESPLWEVTFCTDGSGAENGYYILKNKGTGLCLSPQSDGTIVAEFSSKDTSGIALKGRQDGSYHSTIEKWDASVMAWVGLGLSSQGEKVSIRSGIGEASQAFSFATYVSAEETQLHPVETVDSKADGITLHMFNYLDRSTITNVTGHDEYDIGYLPEGHVKPRLNEKGYPVFKNGKNGETLFSTGSSNYQGEANHLFIQSVYDSTGYYEFSGFHNFAAYDKESGTFTVYEEIGTPNDTNQYFFYQRGNFYPFNRIEAGKYAKINRNLYDGNANPLSPQDPSRNTNLHLMDAPDYYFGMTMEATFFQAKDGSTEDGPILYEFNGDDDLWIFIDGVLILDIGGVHDAWSGAINFATGAITRRAGGSAFPVTIRDCFREAGVFPDGTPWDDNKADQYFKGNTFADYGSHDFKMFYMEHGASASNLEIHFNLPVIHKDDVPDKMKNSPNVRVY